ncbi:hypothetical protein M877_39580 (plasmid) [Streptomyces niveus NCIMB 11891]|nr:hypothetical protein M877_39580 [Streptomyces niveus NCIMB 11891]
MGRARSTVVSAAALVASTSALPGITVVQWGRSASLHGRVRTANRQRSVENRVRVLASLSWRRPMPVRMGRESSRQTA